MTSVMQVENEKTSQKEVFSMSRNDYLYWSYRESSFASKPPTVSADGSV